MGQIRVPIGELATVFERLFGGESWAALAPRYPAVSNR
jgi:hypothetical protein